ncbi:hypothetical protein CDAR_62421 [Caerostris darwini]|uniref:Uncharacterized protein n=1 Tax=Caerostris darwini TaxID=1538125 RepID=A0AAV4UF90_9ARAC|nr:hypothetical protein CDAR_62421 [Caerostris darwini]
MNLKICCGLMGTELDYRTEGVSSLNVNFFVCRQIHKTYFPVGVQMKSPSWRAIHTYRRAIDRSYRRRFTSATAEI